MSLSSRGNIYERKNLSLAFRSQHQPIIWTCTHTYSRPQERTGGCATTPSQRLRSDVTPARDAEDAFPRIHSTLPSHPWRCFISFQLLERRKRVCTELRCLSITFFCVRGQPWRWFIYDFSWVFSSLLSHLLSSGPRLFPFPLPEARVENLLQRFFASFRCLWFHKGRPPFAPNVVAHGKHFSLLFAPKQTWREINPSLFLSVCLHLTNHGFKCEFRNFFLRSACFGFRVCAPAVAAKAPRTFVSGVHRWLSNDFPFREIQVSCGKVCACLQIVLGCS